MQHPADNPTRATLVEPGSPSLTWATPARVWAIVLGTVFLAELLLMLILAAVGPVTPFAKALLDASLLTACLAPVLWVLVFRVVSALRREIAERGRISDELRRAMLAAQSGAQAKTEFLANMSHELRTPMNGVLGMLDLALGEELSTSCREYLGVARTSARSLLRILNDILDFAKAETGKLNFERHPFEVCGLMREAAESLAVSAREKGLALKLRCEPGTPAVVVGDPGRLKQVLLNLLGNALKFTDQGEVVVRVSPAPGPMAEVGAATAITLLFSVADTGPGIPKLAQGKLFQTFSQVDGSTARRHGGTGLGLAICREIVERLGGTIRVDSEPGRGSLFSFTVRLDVPAANDDETLSTAAAVLEEVLVSRGQEGVERSAALAVAPLVPAPTGTGPTRRVLLAEDMPANQMLAVALLRKRGWQVDAVADGAEAVTAWEHGGYDLILMDVQMPGVDGFEATHRIRQREKETGGHTPIVAMTAHALAGDRERCLAAGMDGYVSKPVDQAEFFRAIDLCLAGLSAEGGAAPGQPSDLPRALRALGGDVGILNQLCRYFLREHAHQFHALAAAVEQGNAAAVEHTAHRLKSAVGHFRAERAWNLSQALERMGREGQLEGAAELLEPLRQEVSHLVAFLQKRLPEVASLAGMNTANGRQA